MRWAYIRFIQIQAPIGCKISNPLGPLCLGISSTTIIVPLQQKGHFMMSLSASFSIISCTDFWITSGKSADRPRHLRQNIRLSFLYRLANKPKCRILINPLGSTWSRKRRINSTAVMVIRSLLPVLRSLYAKVTCPFSRAIRRSLEMATLCVYRPKYSSTYSGCLMGGFVYTTQSVS